MKKVFLSLFIALIFLSIVNIAQAALDGQSQLKYWQDYKLDMQRKLAYQMLMGNIGNNPVIGLLSDSISKADEQIKNSQRGISIVSEPIKVTPLVKATSTIPAKQLAIKPIVTSNIKSTSSQATIVKVLPKATSTIPTKKISVPQVAKVAAPIKTNVATTSKATSTLPIKAVITVKATSTNPIVSAKPTSTSPVIKCPFPSKEQGCNFFESLDLFGKAAIRFRSDILDAVRPSDTLLAVEWAPYIRRYVDTDRQRGIALTEEVMLATRETVNDLKKLEEAKNYLSEGDAKKAKEALNKLIGGYEARVSRMAGISTGLKFDQLPLVERANADSIDEERGIVAGMTIVMDILRNNNIAIVNEAYTKISK